MKILIADDHALLAQAICDTLCRSPDFEVTTCYTLQGTLDEVNATPHDVVLLDLRMPGMHGLASITDVVARAGDANVVLFTGQVDRQFVDDAIKLGVKGYIPKTMPLKSLEVALRLIQTGQTFIPHIGSTAAPQPDEKRAPLTDRELHVLRLAADGETNKEIAREISNSETQVKMIMRNICMKLAARNRAHACMIGRERLLI
ncbi:response regulator transcription factor [Roseicyclus mahoneyensis]|uniref:LuxR family two component transcriptional regulator n=1 Tax=Roseicyclus mahoneyensis TaxID=164332 RepID=A0A316GL26_9RHOB|nr:response regulator transcription factor [Roseicyclus mahoneyensis]PWK61316.1 LuxR family two component transcriptional regulator [Roseicyclus mahoneyensis]